MFLQYSSLTQKSIIRQNPTKPIPQNSNQFPSNDQFAFTDFFIRKHPKIISLNPYDLSKSPSTKQHNQLLNQIKNNQIDQLGQNISQDKIFSLPNKKAFQIKFFHSKNKNYSPLQLILRKESSQKFKDKQQLIQQRKINANLPSTARSSFRYSNQKQKVQQNYFSLISEQKFQQRKSLQLKPNFMQKSTQINQQKGQINLINAYKIKSLVLGPNPKEEIYNKSKKYFKKVFQKKSSVKKINTSRAQSQKLVDRDSINFPQTTRLSTEYRNYKTSKNLNFPSTVKQNFRKSAKLNSIFKNLNQDFRQQVKLEPWPKNNEVDGFHDNIQEVEIDFKQQSKKINQEKAYLVSIPGNRSSRNTFRKIYSNKQNTKEKGTICSEK